jgi:preprotein translocase subunit YajC
MLDFLAAGSTAAASGPGLLGELPLLVGFVAIFYFLIWRPQARQQKEHRSKIAAVKKGDQVVTGGGIVGKVTKVDDNYAEIEIAQSVKVKVVKSTIGDIIPPGGTPAHD